MVGHQQTRHFNTFLDGRWKGIDSQSTVQVVAAKNISGED